MGNQINSPEVAICLLNHLNSGEPFNKIPGLNKIVNLEQLQYMGYDNYEGPDGKIPFDGHLLMEFPTQIELISSPVVATFNEESRIYFPTTRGPSYHITKKGNIWIATRGYFGEVRKDAVDEGHIYYFNNADQLLIKSLGS